MQEDRRLRRRERRWILIRDVLVFQGKLILDGLRDFLLAPVSLIAGVIALVGGKERADNVFYMVLRVGRRLEHWIDLFSAVEPAKVRSHRQQDASQSTIESPRVTDNVDAVVSRIEDLLRERAKRNGITRATRDRIDALLDALEAKRDDR